MLWLREAIDESLQWAVFEPHDAMLRQKVVLALSRVLRGAWSLGALVGRTEGEAFFARCDAELNPPERVARGELHARVGVAIVRPAEFVLVRIGRGQSGFEVAEEGGAPWR